MSCELRLVYWGQKSAPGNASFMVRETEHQSTDRRTEPAATATWREAPSRDSLIFRDGKQRSRHGDMVDHGGNGIPGATLARRARFRALARGSNRRCRPCAGTAMSHGLAGAQLCQGRSGRSRRPTRSHRENRPGPCHPHGRPDPAAPDDALYQSNFWATIRLLNALRGLNRRVRRTLAGSAAELGPVPPSALPVAESYPCAA